MNLDELRSVQSKERKKDSLQNLRPSFYQEVGEYIAELEAERDRVAERVDDPFSSPEVTRLTDEIETAKDVVEAIYERRMGKLVKQASLAAAGMAADDEGLTAEEADLFDDLVDRIESNKGRVLDVLEGEEVASERSADASDTRGELESDTVPDRTPADPVPDAESETPPPPEPPEPEAGHADPQTGDGDGVTAADVMGGDGPTIDDDPVPDDGQRDDPTGGVDEGDNSGDDSSPEADVTIGTDEEDVDRVTVRITRDVGPILGIDDREYALSVDDVVTLPEQNATPLVDREAAEPLE